MVPPSSAGTQIQTLIVSVEPKALRLIAPGCNASSLNFSGKWGTYGSASSWQTWVLWQNWRWLVYCAAAGCLPTLPCIAACLVLPAACHAPPQAMPQRWPPEAPPSEQTALQYRKGRAVLNTRHATWAGPAATTLWCGQQHNPPLHPPTLHQPHPTLTPPHPDLHIPSARPPGGRWPGCRQCPPACRSCWSPPAPGPRCRVPHPARKSGSLRQAGSGAQPCDRAGEGGAPASLHCCRSPRKGKGSGRFQLALLSLAIKKCSPAYVKP